MHQCIRIYPTVISKSTGRALLSRCSISKKTSLSKLSLRFDNLVICLWCFWTCLHYRGLCCSWRCLHHRAWAASWRVCTTEACAVPGGVYTTEPELHPDVSALQRPVLFLEVSTCLIHRDQCLLTVEHVRFTSKIIFLFSTVFDLLWK